MSPDSKKLIDLPEECIREILTFVKDDNKSLYSVLLVNKLLHDIVLPMIWKNPPLTRESVVKKYLNELNEEEQTILIPLMVNLPPTRPRPKCASHLVGLNLHDLNVACIRLLATQERFCECGELRIVSIM
ncbi:9946_t:CDS:1, partial [Racocetra persica]